MFGRVFGVALMAALVWGAFHFYGDIDNGPRAVIAQAPISAETLIVE